MSIFAGPNISSNSSLVVYYDMSNTQKSWIGAPATNLISDPYAINGNPSPLILSGYETTNTRTTTLPDVNMRSISDTWFVATKTTSTNGRVFFLDISPGSLSTMTDYCFSMYAYTNDTGITSISCISDNGTVTPVKSSTNYNINNRGTVQRINCVFTSTTGGQVIGVRIGSTDPVGATLYFTGIQVEARSFPTPVVNGTRSNTQALLDLTGRNTITASSLTYSSTGTFSFNGTSNYLSFPYTQNLPNNFTVEAWIYHTSHSSDTNIGHQIVIPYSNYNGWIFSLPGPDSKLQLRHHNFNSTSTSYNIVGASGLALNTWYYVAATDNGTTVTLYVNGVSSTSGASAVSTTNGTMNCYIGSWGPSVPAVFFNGSISSVKIYNRALLATEINQNFNALRGRYGI